MPHEVTKANRAKQTFRDVYRNGDRTAFSTGSLRIEGPLSYKTPKSSFYSVRVDSLVWSQATRRKQRKADVSRAAKSRSFPGVDPYSERFEIGSSRDHSSQLDESLGHMLAHFLLAGRLVLYPFWRVLRLLWWVAQQAGFFACLCIGLFLRTA